MKMAERSMLASSWSTLSARQRQHPETATVCAPWAAQPSATMALRIGVEGTSVRVTVTYDGAGGPFYLYVWDNYGYALFAKHEPTQSTAFEEYLELREIPGHQGGRNVGVMLLNKDYGLVSGPNYHAVGDSGN